jgi:hypothetical protein
MSGRLDGRKDVSGMDRLETGRVMSGVERGRGVEYTYGRHKERANVIVRVRLDLFGTVYGDCDVYGDRGVRLDLLDCELEDSASWSIGRTRLYRY